VPPTFRSIFFFAITVMLSVGLLTTAVVNSVTPTAMNWGTTHTMPAVSFSSQSGVTPPIYCEYGQGDVNGYGYGINCPLDTVYGEMFNAFTTSLRGTYPVNSTYSGTSYPSTLMGISGSIATLSQRLADKVSGTKGRLILPTDALDTCVPRMVITATCSPNLPNGMSFQAKTLSVAGPAPNNIYQVSLCHSGDCGYPRFAPDYGNGMITLFRESDSSNGDTDVSIFSVGKYATNLTSPNIFCKVSAQEVFVPVRITGGVHASLLPSLSCKNQSAPAPAFLTNITRLAEMGLEKSQGQDGKLEAIAHIPNGANRIEAIELGIERMVSVAATNMYGTIDALTGSSATWSRTQQYAFRTRRFRLGVAGKYTVFFILSPAILLILILVSYLAVGFVRESNLGFNPLDATSAIVAGMNRDRLPVEVANLSDANPDALHDSDLLLKYGPVNGVRMGIQAMGSAYVQEGYGAPSPGFATGEYKDQSPGSSPFPTPNIHGGPFFR